jgi:hypothetical protein
MPRFQISVLASFISKEASCVRSPRRILHVGYRGAQRLYDAVANALIARKQDDSPAGYAYL